jgi:hypothetical protein
MMAEEVIEVIRQKVGEIRRVLNLRDVKGSELHQWTCLVGYTSKFGGLSNYECVS